MILSAFENRLTASLVQHTMKTNPARKQNKNIKWSESPCNQSGMKRKGLQRKWFAKKPSLKFKKSVTYKSNGVNWLLLVSPVRNTMLYSLLLCWKCSDQIRVTLLCQCHSGTSHSESDKCVTNIDVNVNVKTLNRNVSVMVQCDKKHQQYAGPLTMT